MARELGVGFNKGVSFNSFGLFQWKAAFRDSGSFYSDEQNSCGKLTIWLTRLFRNWFRGLFYRRVTTRWPGEIRKLTSKWGYFMF